MTEGFGYLLLVMGNRCSLLDGQYERKEFQEEEMPGAKSQLCKCGIFKEEMGRVITAAHSADQRGLSCSKWFKGMFDDRWHLHTCV